MIAEARAGARGRRARASAFRAAPVEALEPGERRRRADPLLRGDGAPARPARRRSTVVAALAPPLGDRQRPARAAVAGLTWRASSTWASSETRRGTSTTGRAAAFAQFPRATARGRRAAQPAALDDGPVPDPLRPPTLSATVRRVRRMAQPVRARPGLARDRRLGIAWGFVMHSMGWAQLAHFAQVRALADGQAQIDRWHWETQGQGLDRRPLLLGEGAGAAALLTLPAYLALNAAGARSVATDAADNAQPARRTRGGRRPGARTRTSPVRLRPAQRACASRPGSRTRRRSSGRSPCSAR